MEDLETYRPLLFSIAYRMTGSASEAEDLVQESLMGPSTRSSRFSRPSSCMCASIISSRLAWSANTT